MVTRSKLLYKGAKPVLKDVESPELPNLSWGLKRLQKWWTTYWDSRRKEALREFEKKRKLEKSPDDYCWEDTDVCNDLDWDSAVEEKGFFDNNSEFAGCCGVLEIHDLCVPEFRNDVPCSVELAAAAIEVLQEAQRVAMVVATTTRNMKAEAAILEGIGFKAVGSGKNPKSGNVVTVWLATLR